MLYPFSEIASSDSRYETKHYSKLDADNMIIYIG